MRPHVSAFNLYHFSNLIEIKMIIKKILYLKSVLMIKDQNSFFLFLYISTYANHFCITLTLMLHKLLKLKLFSLKVHILVRLWNKFLQLNVSYSHPLFVDLAYAIWENRLKHKVEDPWDKRKALTLISNNWLVRKTHRMCTDQWKSWDPRQILEKKCLMKDQSFINCCIPRAVTQLFIIYIISHWIKNLI
jgi:hypothetical protein